MNMSAGIFKRRTGATLLLLFGLICPVFAQNGAEADEAAIRNNVNELVEGWNTKSGARFAKVFAEDADYVVINGSFVKGRAEIEKSHHMIFTTIFKDTMLTLNVKQIRFLRPDVAIVHVTGRRNGPTEELKQAIMTLVMTKERDSWQIAAFQNTAAPLR